MADQTFAVTYTLPSSYYDTPGSSVYTDKKVILEQEEWAAYSGYLTKANMVRYIGMLIYGEEFYDPLMDCSSDDGTLITIVHAYPFDNTPYRMGTNYGEFDGIAETSTPSITAMIQFNPGDEGSVSYPISSIQEIEWLGRVYDINHNVMPGGPAVSFARDQITLSQKVYGTLSLKYETQRTSYVLTAEPRNENVEFATQYDIIVWARYSDGVSWLSLSEPPRIEDLLTAVCGRGTRISVKVKPPDCKPYGPDPEDRLIEYDYCTLERTTPKEDWEE